jgi:RHS repeat-associated protein
VEGYDRPEPLKFTGHERDFVGGSGYDNVDNYLDYMHARNYSPKLGRFLSVDPTMDLKKTIPNPQMWNRYAYVVNNPLRNTDPDGREHVNEPGFTKPMTAENLAFDENTPGAIKGAFYVEGALLSLGGAAEALGAAGRYLALRPQLLLALMGWGSGMIDGHPSLPATKAVNLPAWKTVTIDLEHVLERHTAEGSRTSEAASKFVGMTASGIESAIRQAYRHSEKIGVQGDRVLLRGTAGKLMIEMWLNKTTKTIETAYPVAR